nr:MAG TPA: hypothetical protein [Caudoviricetes sp.]
MHGCNHARHGKLPNRQRRSDVAKVVFYFRTLKY